MNSWDKVKDLVSHTVSTGDDHLGYALDLLYECRATIPEAGDLPLLVHRRVATSCIIHTFSALESAINRLGYEIFSDVNSPRYMPEDRRGFLLQKFLALDPQVFCS
jgi:hypothetical protein